MASSDSDHCHFVFVENLIQRSSEGKQARLGQKQTHDGVNFSTITIFKYYLYLRDKISRCPNNLFGT